MKAFDTIISGQWLLALRFYNTPKNLFKWIEAFVNSQKKAWLNSVPGGSVLGQVLFVVLLNLLPDEVERSDLFLLPDNRI